MKKLHFIVCVLLILAMPHQGFSAIIHVPATYSTIQEAIDASVNGDMVLVEPNIYYEHINLNGKNIILCSNYFTTGNPAFIASTIIDGSNNGRAVTISQFESSSCQVVGFTIQNGNSSSEWDMVYGGGILIWDASPQISHCVIQNNYAPEFGGGICIGQNSGSKVRNCTIQNNTADSFGGGVSMSDCTSDAEVVNSVISGNTITCNCDWNGGGGGVNLFHAGRLVNCLVVNNSAPNAPVGGGGVHCDWADDATKSILVIGCTIANNTALGNGGVSYVIAGGEFRNCIIWGNTDNLGNVSNYDGNLFVYSCTDPLPTGAGNISSDPNFVIPAAGNFRLSAGSPCIDAGDSAYNNQATDLDGNSRIFNNIIDMGAYEYGSSAGVTVQVGEGSDISSIFPIYSCYGYNYSQQIYLGSEIISGGGSPGLISRIRFFYSGGGSEFSTWKDWTVYLGNTTKAEFADSADWVPVGSMTQVFSDTIPVPVDSSWVEITLNTPFYYSGNNIVVAVDENSDGWECTAQWGSFYTGSPRGLNYYNDNYNPDPLLPPPANQGPDPDIARIQFDLNPGFGILAGHVYEEPLCNVPIVGATITSGAYSATSDASGYYWLIMPVGTYTDVTAVFHDASQTISPVTITPGDTTAIDFCLTPYLAPPVALHATINGENQNNVHLTWLPPGGVEDQWIHWDNGNIAGALGYLGPMVFSVASRWPVADIAAYNGKYLKKIRFDVGEATASYTLKVWKGANASTLLLSQVVDNPYINTWNEITLDTPVLIDGADEFWFGYEVTQTAGYPAGLASGPAVVGKGDMITDGGPWFSMKESWGWEFNWALQGFVAESAVPGTRQLLPMVQTTTPQQVFNNHNTASLKPQLILFEQKPAGTIPANPALTVIAQPKPTFMSPLNTSSLIGYNVYRDYVKIASNLSDLFYDDPALPKGGYDYQVSAQYDNGESALIGPLHVDIYTCFPPTNLTVTLSTLTTVSADLSWTPSTLSTNPQWTLEWGTAGFSQGYGTTVLISGTPSYSLTGLTPGTEYDFYVSTYCSSTDASTWVKKTFRTHYFNCPTGSIPEAEVCGANTNGCDVVNPLIATINNGETVCGTSWLSRTHRDSDWYPFILSGPADVTVWGNAEFSSTIAIAAVPCSANYFYSYKDSWAGHKDSTTTRLTSGGSYFVYVAPTYNEQVVCDSMSRYWVKLSCNSCLSPDSLNATNITSSTADLKWKSSASTWNIEWGPFGFARGSGTMITGTGSNPYHLAGLTLGYAYSYYVQSNCGSGSTSNWAGPYTFFLPCPATALPYAEDFTSQLIGFTPQCWQVKNIGAPSNWIVDLNSYAGGVFPQLMFVPSNPYFSGRSYLTSPIINTVGKDSLHLSFKHYINAYSTGSSCEIWTTSDSGNTWHSVWSVSLNGILGPETKNLSITTPDVGSATFQFAFAVNGNSWDIGTWQIDDISVTGLPQTGKLQGVVANCSNAALLQGVTVTAGTNTTTTNASGFYQFLNIPAGSYTVDFSMTGYVTKSVPGILVTDGLVTSLDTCLVRSGPPATATVQNITLTSGQTSCFDATQTITVAGSGTTFIVENGGSASMIAGIKINYLPGTWVKHGGYMLGKIAPNGPYCAFKEASIANSDEGGTSDQLVAEKSGMKVYPNPTNGKFRVELTGERQTEPVMIEIFGIRGDKVFSEKIPGEMAREFSLSGNPAGIYFIKVVAGENVMTAKLVKTR